MEQVELFLLFTEPLDKLKLHYIATGSVASMIYGLPRFTNDLDIVLDLPSSKIKQFINTFSMSEFYCPPEEVLLVESKRTNRGHFNLIHHKTGFKADIYIRSKYELHEWAFRNRRQIILESGKNIWVAPPEYVIIRKLEFYREGRSEKHIFDIQGMLEISGDNIDFTLLLQWIKKSKLETEWNLVVSKDEGGD